MGQSIVECELLTGTRSAEGIYGQRSREPRSKAEHMAAPTNTADVKKTVANSEPSTHVPFVGTGRALQAENDDVELMGLALLYPALDGTFVFLAIMDIRARSISLATRPRRP